jgi:ABC-2 type transport system permease protein
VTSLRGRPGGFTTGIERSGIVERARRVWDYRRILLLLIGRDLKVRYAGSVLGYVWSVLDPLLMSLVYFVIFTRVFPRGSLAEEPYMIFLLCGQLPWQWFNQGVTSASRALLTEAQMVRSTNVPRELWIIRNVASNAVQYLLSLPVLAAFALFYTRAPHKEIVLMPLAMLLQAILLTGIGLVLAPLTVLVRDVERVIRIALRLMFYLSPVLYSLQTNKAHRLHEVFKFNPMAGILSLYRSVFFPRELDGEFVLYASVISVAVLVIGMFVFARLERAVLKEI